MRRLFLRSRKKVVRFSLVTTNFVLLAIVVLFVAKASSSSQSVSQNAISSNSDVSTTVTAPLDQVSSADIAVDVARTIGLPESTSVTNHADSVNATEATAPADTSVVSKPQLIANALPSKKDIHTYVVVSGDTISSIAAKMGVSSDSIRWSNGLSSRGDTVAVGKQLVLPPAGVNGVVYTVQAGDTPDTLAQKYGASKDAIVVFNDAELSGLTVGEQILIPDGVVKTAAASQSYSYYSSGNTGVGLAWGSSPIYGRNGYDYGWCTWYVANRISMPANWGNAYSWARSAAASGWTVSNVPHAVGDIAQTTSGNHVAYVEAVSPDGTMIKYSDMNGIAGWGRVGYSDWVPAGHFQHYIYH